MINLNADAGFTCAIGRNQLGVDRFKGVFYVGGKDDKLRYNQITTTNYYLKNTSLTTNASGYVDVDPLFGVGSIPVGSLFIQANVPQNTNGTRLEPFEAGDGTFRIYAYDSAGSAIISANVRMNIKAEVIENF